MVAILNSEQKSDDSEILSSENRAFKFGDSIFETIRYVNGSPINLENHFNRLSKACDALSLDMPATLTLTSLESYLIQLAKSNNLNRGGKARLTLWRKNGKGYFPNGKESEFLITSSELTENEFVLNSTGFTVGVYNEIKKSINKISSFKTGNALQNVLASVYAGENNFNDALLLNEKGNIIESTSSNIFIVSNGVLYTPGIEEGCVGGTMRMNIINIALKLKVKIYVCPLNLQNLLAADEIFLTNAIRGVEWVGSFRSKRYFNTFSKKIMKCLNESLINSSPEFQESSLV